MKWRYTTRKVNGKSRAVKVSKNGKYVRIVGKKNYTDRTRVSKTRK